MFKAISVDGLRSLKDFRMELNPGMNILVGPNGSGKSNILIAFELLSKLYNLKILSGRNSIASVGIAKLFDVRKKDKNLCIQIEGVVNSFSHDQSASIMNTAEPIDVHYKFECEIVFQPFQQNKLFFSKQNLELTAVGPLSGKRTKMLNFEYADEELINIQLKPDYLQKDIPTTDFESYFRYKSESLKFNSIIYEFSKEIIPFSRIMDEFDFYELYNIKPEVIRYEIEVPNGNDKDTIGNCIDSRGGRLLPTLLEVYNLSKKQKNTSSNIDNFNFDDIYKKIIGYLKLACPEVLDLEVFFNSKRNIIESDAIFKDAKGNSDRIPLELMSDGTLKWLSLISALLTSKNMFLLEEPENYIHPSMQKDFVDLMRATIKHRQIIGIFATHSESILNSLDPSEVIVTNFQNGRTVVNRIENIEKIKEKLRSTGFGLGWYYITGSMDPIPVE